MARGVRGGFTLIELLTVMTILAVLAAILLPATATAKALAQRAACAGQLRQVGVGFAHYVTASRGFYPPYGSSRTSRACNYLLAAPPTVEDWTALWADGQLPVSDMLYCPATRTPAHKFDTPQNRWPPGLVRTGYSRRYFATGPASVPTHVSRVGGGQALAADLLVSPAQVGFQHRTGVNVAYADGAVEFHPEVIELFAAAGVSGNRTAGNSQLDAVWAGLDRKLRIPE